MNIQIKNRINGAIMYQIEAERLKDALEMLVNQKADLFGAYLSGANLASAELAGAELASADLSCAYLASANISGADLAGAELARANLSGANLAVANLSVANLSGANLARANLAGANLSCAYLSGANLFGADLADNKIVQLGPIGSRKSYTIFKIKYDEVRCGCWTGTLAEFIDRVHSVYPENHIHRLEYDAAIEFFKAIHGTVH